MGRKVSFKEQMFRSLNSKNCYGKSKYLAKQESYRQGNGGKVDGIYSKKTMSDYKKVATQFHTWQKEKGYNFRSIDDVGTSHIIEYLQERQAKGCSSWTTSHDLSSLNKIFGTSISKKDACLTPRHNANIKNNRGFGKNYRHSTYAKNKDQTFFISACGVRRQSLTILTPSHAIRDNNNMIIGFRVIEKGGKARNCYVRNECQQAITSFVDNHLATQGNNPFWNKVDKNLNTHWYRGEYAHALYHSLLSAKQNGKDYFRGYKDTFINQNKLSKAIGKRNATTKGYDSEVLGMVSQNLGHNRIDVVYTNYLSRYS